MRRLLPPLALAFCAGASLRLAYATPAGVVYAAMAAAMAVMMTSRSSRIALLAAVGLAFSVGILRTEAWIQGPADSVDRMTDRKWVRLHGIVRSDPMAYARGTIFDLAVSRADSFRGSEPVSGCVRITVPSDITAAPTYGERLIVLGRLHRPDDAANPNEVPPAQYLRRDNVLAVMRAVTVERAGPPERLGIVALAVRCRHYLDRGIRATLPPTEAALLAGLLFSDTSALPEDIQQDFARAGTIHILSTSGLHVALLAWLLSVVMPAKRPAARRRRAIFLLAVLILYAPMTGLRPAVVRAVVMTGAILAAPVFEREPDLWSALALAAICLVAASPGNLLDPGFQLSFAAAVALALWFDGRRSPARNRIWRWASGSVQASVVASLATAPLTAHYFGTFSVASPLSNLLVVPALAPAMGLGLFQGAIWKTWPGLARGLGYLNRPVLDWMLGVTSCLGGEHWSAYDVGSWSTAVIVSSYAAMALVWAWLRRWPREGKWASCRAAVGWSVALAVVLVGMLWPAWGPRPPLRVTFLDVGQGDCTLIQTPCGHAVLVDAGGCEASGGAQRYDVGDRIVLPALRRAGVSRLDVVVLTHRHEDHAGGMPAVLTALPTGVWFCGRPGFPQGLRTDPAKHGNNRMVVRMARAGQRVILEPGVEMDVLAPSNRFLTHTHDDENNNSLIARLVYGDTSFLLTGDAEAEEEDRLLARKTFLRSDVLKVGHHGGATSSGIRWLRAVQPKVAVISCGRANRYGHPAADTLNRLHTVGATVYRTDTDGAVVVESDGRRIRASQCRWRLP